MIQLIPYIYLILAMLDRTAHGLTSSICARVPDGNFVRSSQSCNSYNRCINGQPQHGVCPKGYSFGSRSQMCETNIEVDCRLCSPFGIQHIPNPDSCQTYYRCVNGVRTSMTLFRWTTSSIATTVTVILRQKYGVKRKTTFVNRSSRWDL
ncbi:hypothetical protein HA402_012296 [Bradysia odoriphaga]|nr:hypothetical protein HA402_012296 [Bradysia odoriphaga]